MQCSRCGAALPSGEGMCLSCGSVVQAVVGDALTPGTLIGQKYEVVEPIGAGGMGRVYRAIQRPLGVEVCVKTLHSGATADPQFVGRFEREAKTTSQLRHPNIVAVTDFGAHVDGSLYLVMEYVRGRSLADETKGKKIMSAARAAQICGQVCDALSSAHAKGVIHRDLKPANIMLTDLPGQPDFVKVLDFGSAVMLDGGEEAARLTRAGTIIGTPAFMAPEYILGRGLDARVDVYALGVLLYRLLCGSTPFRGELQQVFAQQVTVPPEPPSRRNPEADVSPQMERVVLRALAKDPARRYGSAAELKAAMLHALAGAPVEEFPESEYQADGAPAVDAAPKERVAVAVSVRADALTAEDLGAIETAANAHGGVPRAGEGAMTLVFGLDREGPEAASDAMRFALELTSGPLRERAGAGVHDAQASCRGRAGQAGFKFELFGDGQRLAETLGAHAAPGQVLVSGAVARLVSTELRLMPVHPPARVNEPVFVLTSTLRADATIGTLPFVGHAAEQRALIEVAVGAKAGRVCLLEGPAGVGKTRLVNEVVSQAGRLGVFWCVVPASARPLGAAHPVSVVSAIGWSAPDGSASTTERYAVDLMLGRTDRRIDGLSGERRQLRLVSAALEGVSRRVQHGPVVLVLDEMHLADDLTWALAQRLAESAQMLGVSVILCARAAADVPFALPANALRTALGPLSEREAHSLAASAPGAPDEDAVLLAVARAARGVPLVAEELLRAVARGRYDLVDAADELGPERALDLLLEDRLHALDEGGRAVLGAAAVLGYEPDAAELIALVGGPDAGAGWLPILHEESLLLRSPAGTLRFAFPALHAAALATVPRESLDYLHAEAAEIIAASPAAGVRAFEVAEHRLRAGQAERAFDELLRAADAARGDGEVRRAVQCLHLAASAGAALGPARARDRLTASRDLGRALIQLGRLGEAEEILRTAHNEAREAGEPILAADLLRLHGRVLVIHGSLEDGWREIEGVQLFAERRGESVLAAEACADLADAAERSGDGARGAELLRRGASLIEGRQDPDAVPVRIQIYNRLGRAELQSNNLTGAIALFTQALDLAERCNDRYQAAGLLGNLGGAYAKQGDNPTALAFTERALRASEGLGDQIGVARQSFNLALLRLAAGQTRLARQLLRGAQDASRRAGWRDGLGMSSAALAKIGEA